MTALLIAVTLAVGFGPMGHDNASVVEADPARLAERTYPARANNVKGEKRIGHCNATGRCAIGVSAFEGCRFKSPKRSDRPKAEFRRRVPCPATNRLDGACPGWELDHVLPLCCGGADRWENLRWLEHDLHKLRHNGGVNCHGFPVPAALPRARVFAPEPVPPSVSR